MIKILHSNPEYENKIKKYEKKDGILALILFGIFVLFYSIIAVLQIQVSFIKDNILVVGCIINILIIIITILFVKIKHQKLDTIGLYKGKWKTSCIIGIVLASIYFFNNCLSNLINGSSLVSIKEIVILLIYYLLISLCEEIAFRGYIGTRIYGLIKKKWIAIIAVGFLFIIMHFPYRMIAYGMTISELTIGNLSWIFDLLITHIIFNFIYLKTDSLYGSIIPHWISNLAYNIVSK